MAARATLAFRVTQPTVQPAIHAASCCSARDGDAPVGGLKGMRRPRGGGDGLRPVRVRRLLIARRHAHAQSRVTGGVGSAAAAATAAAAARRARGFARVAVVGIAVGVAVVRRGRPPPDCRVRRRSACRQAHSRRYAEGGRAPAGRHGRRSVLAATGCYLLSKPQLRLVIRVMLNLVGGRGRRSLHWGGAGAVCRTAWVHSDTCPLVLHRPGARCPPLAHYGPTYTTLRRREGDAPTQGKPEAACRAGVCGCLCRPWLHPNIRGAACAECAFRRRHPPSLATH